MPIGPRPRPPDFTFFVKLTSTFQTMPWSCGFWFKVDTEDTPTLADFQNTLEDIAGAWGDDIFPFLSEACTGVDANGVFYGAGSDTIDAEAFVPFTGGGTNTSLPINCAACISWPTATHYRGGHPRSYVGGLPDDAAATVSTFDTTFRDNLVGGATSFRNDVNDIDVGLGAITLGVVSFVDNGDWRDPPIFKPYTGNPTIDARIDSQRRRLGR